MSRATFSHRLQTEGDQMPIDEDSATLLIVGSGAAGLMAACVAGPIVSDVVLVTNGGLGRSNSVMAQGGLHVPVDSPDGRRRMLHDMMSAGGPSVDPVLAGRYVDEIIPTIELLRGWGLRLDVDNDGQLVRRMAGAMSEPRIVGTGDRIGPSVIRVLRSRLDRVPVTVMANTGVIDIRPVSGGLEVELAGRAGIKAAAAIVATGGDTYGHALQVGEPCTNPENNNSEMAGVLAGLGLSRVDEGQYQWQPFGLVDASTGRPGVARPCVPETVVAHGVRVLDVHGAEVVDATAGRSIVTSAMKRAIDEGRGIKSANGTEGLLLTLSDLPEDLIRSDYRHLAAVLDRNDLFGKDVLIAPFLHYQLGGFITGKDCSCGVPGLFLAGEIVGGIHGRSRLMGNGLTDSLVHGRRAALSAAAHLNVIGSGPGE